MSHAVYARGQRVVFQLEVSGAAVAQAWTQWVQKKKVRYVEPGIYHSACSVFIKKKEKKGSRLNGNMIQYNESVLTF